MRLIASPMSGAIERVVIFGTRLDGGSGTVSVRTISRQTGLGQALDGRIGQDAVGRAGVDLVDALALERPDGLGQGPGRVDLVVDDDGPATADVADDVQQLGSVESCRRAASR